MKRLPCLPVLMVVLVLLAAGCRERQVATDDQSTPQATVRSLVHEMDRLGRPEAFDARGLERFFMVQTPQQQEYVEAWIALLAASRQLHDQARAQFGREDARQLLGPARPGEDHIRQFAAPAEQHIENDRATLVVGTGQALHFQLDGQEWRILPGEEGGVELAEATRVLRGLAGLLVEVAAAIQDRQVETAADARQAIAQEAPRVVLGG